MTIIKNMFLYGDSLFHEYKNEFILEATTNYSIDYLLVLGKFPPGKSPPIKLPPGKFPPENSNPENCHLEYSCHFIVFFSLFLHLILRP